MTISIMKMEGTCSLVKIAEQASLRLTETIHAASHEEYQTLLIMLL